MVERNAVLLPDPLLQGTLVGLGMRLAKNIKNIKKMKMEDFKVHSFLLGMCLLAFKISLQHGCSISIFSSTWPCFGDFQHTYFRISFLHQCINKTTFAILTLRVLPQSLIFYFSQGAVGKLLHYKDVCFAEPNSFPISNKLCRNIIQRASTWKC